MYREPLRPRIHFSPRMNWMNDPNGCVYFNGTYHLFYQYSPYGRNWGPMHWGRASSTDLVHWREGDIALAPDDELGEAFSGSAVVDEENTSGLFGERPGLVALYTSHRGVNGNRSVQQQSLAWSTDGRDWLNYEQNPVIPNPGPNPELSDFRDPKVFRYAGESWSMVVSAGDELRFYRSDNLIEWTLSGTFDSPSRPPESLWECPDLFPLTAAESEGDEKWVLAASLTACGSVPAPSLVRYFIGGFDGSVFTPDDPEAAALPADYGYDFYAAQSWNGIPEEDGRRIWIGWASHWAYAGEIPTHPWRGAMSLPRSVELGRREGRFVLKQRPAAELDMLRSQSFTMLPNSPFSCTEISDDSALDIVFLARRISSGKGRMVFQYQSGDSFTVEINGEHNRLTLDRTQASARGFHSNFIGVVNAPLPDEGDIDIRLILDHSLVEIYAMNGEIVLTAQILPEGELKSVEAISNGVFLDDINVHVLSSAWLFHDKKRGSEADSANLTREGGAG